MRISDWSSDVCSSDLRDALLIEHMLNFNPALEPLALGLQPREQAQRRNAWSGPHACDLRVDIVCKTIKINGIAAQLQELCRRLRSEEHTSELQSLMRISYAVFCLKQQKNKKRQILID